MKKKIFNLTVASFLGIAVLITAVFVPTQKAEASSDAAAIAVFTGVAGLMAGAALGSAAQQNRQCRARHQRQRSSCNQRLIMSNVLAKYSPAYHDYWVEYVVVDLQGCLTYNQQRQLLYALEQKRQTACSYAYRY